MNALRRLRPEIEIDEEEIDPEELSKISIKPKDFNSSLKDIEPSAMREVFVEVPETNYSDVGGLTEEKEKLVESVEWPLDYGDVFSHFDTEAPKGILLYGPPGNGKTLLAKAVANASESNFISVKGPELMNKYVGESEKGIREIFKKARQNSPTVIFFDEIDSIANERGSSNDNEVSERMVSQLLTELDGLEELSDVVVIAATNRPDIIDSALIRTGRLEKTIEVDLPNQKERKDIIDIHTKNMPIEEDVDIEEISELTEGFTGSDIEALCREAAMIKMRRLIKENNDIKKEKLRESKVSNKDFDKALENVSKSLKEEEIEMYNKISERVSEIDDQDVETSQTRSFQ
jgi:transitional endoplasmic reticulum ATPase